MTRIAIPLVGPSSHARSPAHQSGRTLNLYPEVGDTDAKAIVALNHVAGAFRRLNFSSTYTETLAIRGMHATSSRMFVVLNQRIIEILPGDSFRVLANLQTFSGRVGISDNNDYLIIGDGTGFFALNLATEVLTQVVDEDGAFIRGTISRWVDGYTIYVHRESDRFSYSAINAPTTISGLDYATAEGNPDPLANLIIANRELVFVGERSTEFWANTGDSDNAFERIPGGFVAHGCAARWSVCEFDNTVVMVGRNADGQGVVWRLGAAGQAPGRISTHAVENALSAALYAGSAEEISAFTYQEEGHLFYVLNIPSAAATTNRLAQPSQTWVFDAATNMWHERAHLNIATGQFERIKPDFHVFWEERHYTGAFDRGHLLELNRNFYQYDEDPQVKLRETAHIHYQGKRISFHKLWIDLDVGVGKDAGASGDDPQLMLQYSDDGGNVWSNEIWRPIGKIGEYRTRVVFHRLGSSRDRVFRVSVADRVRVTLLAAFADVTIGA